MLNASEHLLLRAIMDCIRSRSRQSNIILDNVRNRTFLMNSQTCPLTEEDRTNKIIYARYLMNNLKHTGENTRCILSQSQMNRRAIARRTFLPRQIRSLLIHRRDRQGLFKADLSPSLRSCFGSASVCSDGQCAMLSASFRLRRQRHQNWIDYPYD